MDVTALCRAYVGYIARVPYDDIAYLGIKKGQSGAVSAEETARLLARFKDCGRYVASGPGGNTIAGVVALGGQAAYIGKTAGDDAGKIFAQDFEERGVSFLCTPERDGSTAQCIIFVDPDGERTVTFYPGVSNKVTAIDIEKNKTNLAQSKMLYLTYFLRRDEDSPLIENIKVHAQHVPVATTLQSWNSQNDRNFAPRVLSSADIILGNAHECSVFANDLDHTGIDSIAAQYPEKIIACTQGQQGVTVFHEGKDYSLPASSIDYVCDTTGAGDAFAAGFLYGMTQNVGLVRAAHWGMACAADMIQEEGTRPTKSWRYIMEAQQ